MLLERVFIGFLGHATFALHLCFFGRYVDLDRSWTGSVDDVPESCLLELALSGEDPVLVVEFSLQLLKRFGPSKLTKFFAEVYVVVVHCRKVSSSHTNL